LQTGTNRKSRKERFATNMIDFLAGPAGVPSLRILKKLREEGFEAYFAGGCVRDYLRGEVPQDYDIATSARAEQVRRLFPQSIMVGAAFGVVIVPRGSVKIEVTTYRSEGPYSDGRHPDSVEWTDARGDVMRRDFTINGMLYDPEEGKVIDYVKGREDLERKLVRAIGEPARRFEEDKLRMIRGVRFAAKLDFAIEKRTASAIKKMRHKITQVSAERIRDEFLRIITDRNRKKGLMLLDKMGLLEIIMPEATAMKGVPQAKAAYPGEDLFSHVLEVVDILKSPSAELAMAALLHDIGKPEAFERSGGENFNFHESIGAAIAKRILKRMKFSREQIGKITWVVKKHMALGQSFKMRLSTLKRLFSNDAYPILAECYRSDVTASGGGLKNYKYACTKYEEFIEEGKLPPPLINGHDLIALGLKPGPIFKKLLDNVRLLQLDEKISTKKEALAIIRNGIKEYEKSGGKFQGW